MIIEINTVHEPNLELMGHIDSSVQQIEQRRGIDREYKKPYDGGALTSRELIVCCSISQSDYNLNGFLIET